MKHFMRLFLESRWFFVAVALAFAAGGNGVRLGSSVPSWPDPVAWTTVAFMTALLVLAYSISPSDLLRCWAWAFILGALSARLIGALFFGATTAARWGGGGAWALGLLFALSARSFIRDKGFQ